MPQLILHILFFEKDFFSPQHRTAQKSGSHKARERDEPPILLDEQNGLYKLLNNARDSIEKISEKATKK